MGRTKGITVVDLVKALRSQRARAHELLPPDLHHYLESRILVGAWYPDEDVQRLLRAFIQLMGGSMGWERAGTLLARKNLATVYANMLPVQHGVPRAMRLLPGLWRNYHDTGDEKAIVTKGKVRVEISGFAVRSADYCKLIGAYNGEVIQLAGGRVNATRKVACTANG